MNVDGGKPAMAEQRTDLAEDRTLLANERTFASWLRTGLGAVAVALGLSALFRSLDPTWIAKALTTLFILIGMFVFWAAERRATKVQHSMTAHEVEPFERRKLKVIAYALMLACAGIIAAVWIFV